MACPSMKFGFCSCVIPVASTKLESALYITKAETRSFEITCSDEGLTLETSAYNHLHGVKLIHINLRLIHYTFEIKTDSFKSASGRHRKFWIYS